MAFVLIPDDPGTVESVAIRPPTPSLDPPADGDDFRRNGSRNRGIRGQDHLYSAKIASDDAEGPNGYTTEVLPTGVFPTSRHRPTPYLWNERDIARLLESAGTLRPPFRAATHQALFGLLAASGMRLGEALGLLRGDVDLETGVITIRHAKFDRERLVPLHQSTTTALRAYALQRDLLWSVASRSVLLLERRHRALS